MRRIRYFTETLVAPLDPHDRTDPNHKSVIGSIHGSGDMHWVRLDANTIYGFAYLNDEAFNFLQDHPTVCIHPSIYDKTPLKDHFTKKGKMNHHASLASSIGLTASDSTIDAIAKAVDKGHTFLNPDK